MELVFAVLAACVQSAAALYGWISSAWHSALLHFVAERVWLLNPLVGSGISRRDDQRERVSFT